jgi:hypothetical protein
MSIDLGGIFVVVFEALAEAGKRSVVCGEGVGRGEYGFSEKVVVEEAGDDAPPQPKKDPSLEPPGDLGWVFCTGVELDEAVETLRVCGGAALVENTDIVAELGWLVELEPLYHGPVDSVTVVRFESLVKRACFVPVAGAAREVWLCHGTGRVVFLGVLWSMAVTGSGDETSGVAAGRWSEGLVNSIST